jgi:hypothetical protein
MAAKQTLASPTDPWSLARNCYIEDLSEEEKKLFANASLENLFYSASVAQKEYEEKSKSRALYTRLEPFIAAIDQYAAALDVYSNSCSLIMSPLWGSIRVLLHVKFTLYRFLLLLDSRLAALLTQTILDCEGI